MKKLFSIDNLLAKNLVSSAESTQYLIHTEQVEMLFLAFEKKIAQYSKEELLNLGFYLNIYKALEPGADNYITRNYLKLVQQYVNRSGQGA